MAHCTPAKPEKGPGLHLKKIANQWARYFDIYVVFLISGLWHGANWTFLIWGGLHATFLAVSLATKSYRTQFIKAIGLNRFPRVLTGLRVLVVFNLVAYAWIFFRANNFSEALYIASHVFSGFNLQEAFGPTLATQLGTPRSELVIGVGLILVLETVQFVNEYSGGVKSVLDSKPTWARWAVYYSLIAAIIFLGEYQTQQFIYFQF